MVRVNIYVEGVADAKFLFDFIKVKYKRNIICEKLKINEDKAEVEIKVLDGTGNFLSGEQLKLLSSLFRMFEDQGGKNLVVLDADFKKDTAGFQSRNKDLLLLKKHLPFDFFLLPNHKDDGDLETLLEQIINPVNQPILECWDNYEKCLKTKQISGRSTALTTPARKTKIYAYLEALLGESKKQKQKIKELNRKYNDSDHWNLNAQYLDSLKNFLDKYI